MNVIITNKHFAKLAKTLQTKAAVSVWH